MILNIFIGFLLQSSSTNTHVKNSDRCCIKYHSVFLGKTCSKWSHMNEFELFNNRGFTKFSKIIVWKEWMTWRDCSLPRNWQLERLKRFLSLSFHRIWRWILKCFFLVYCYTTSYQVTVRWTVDELIPLLRIWDSPCEQTFHE